VRLGVSDGTSPPARCGGFRSSAPFAELDAVCDSEKRGRGDTTDSHCSEGGISWPKTAKKKSSWREL